MESKTVVPALKMLIATTGVEEGFTKGDESALAAIMLGSKLF